jgi:hypothetical protein
VVATGKTSLSGHPGSDSFQTVCGVIVGGKTSRYLCEATDLAADKGVQRTALRFPDNDLLLVWGNGKRVDVQIKGLAAPIRATDSTSEGETDIFTLGEDLFLLRRSRAGGNGGQAFPAVPQPFGLLGASPLERRLDLIGLPLDATPSQRAQVHRFSS